MRTKHNVMRSTDRGSLAGVSLRAERSNSIFGQRLLRPPWLLAMTIPDHQTLFQTNGSLQHKDCDWRLVLLIVLLLSWWFPNGLHAEAKQTLAVQTVTAALHQHVLQQGPWQPTQVEVEVRSLPSVPLPPGPVQLQILRPGKGITPGVQSFQLAVRAAGKPFKTVWVRAEVRIFDNVMVTSRPLAHAETISPTDVRFERREVGTLHTRTFTRIEEVDALQAARAIKVNEILTPRMVQSPQVIRPRTLVTVVYETARLRVETRGQALDGGKVGEVIRIKNLSSGELLEGQVRNAREVIVR